MCRYGDPCPGCKEEQDIRWIETTQTTDTWACGECGYTWEIEIALPAQTETKLTERAEIHG